MHESSGRLYDGIGTSAGNIGDENGQDVVGLLFPTEIEDEDDERFLTLPAAKALLIDLRDAIEAVERHQRGESME